MEGESGEERRSSSRREEWGDEEGGQDTRTFFGLEKRIERDGSAISSSRS